MTCITGRNASRPASFSTAITSQSRSGLSWPTCRQARGLRWWLVVSAGVVMAETRRADAGSMLCLRTGGERISRQMIILPRPGS
jgi:hypothetical protein